jgi:succinate dehydrogenase hydrophobic anchor subunit
MALGLQVIIEDYVHVERGETIGILAVRIGSALLAVVAVGAVLKIATGVN